MELKKITSAGPQQMLELGRWTSDAPEESRQSAEDWKRELDVRQAAREKAEAELVERQLDHRRLSKLEAETFKSSGAVIAELRGEGIRNPACDFEALASLEAKEMQRARFISNCVRQIVTQELPKQALECKRLVWQEKEAVTQCWTLATAFVYGQYLDLLAPLAQEQGMTATSPSPKMVQYEEKMLRARAEERAAHEEYVKANGDWAALSYANQTANL